MRCSISWTAHIGDGEFLIGLHQGWPTQVEYRVHQKFPVVSDRGFRAAETKARIDRLMSAVSIVGDRLGPPQITRIIHELFTLLLRQSKLDYGHLSVPIQKSEVNEVIVSPLIRVNNENMSKIGEAVYLQTPS